MTKTREIQERFFVPMLGNEENRTNRRLITLMKCCFFFNENN